jgi:hypothetical protein
MILIIMSEAVMSMKTSFTAVKGVSTLFKNTKVYVLIIVIGILVLAGSCGSLPIYTEDKSEADSIPHDAAFKSSSFLLLMDDMKAINLAANYLKEQGETVTFQETYIEYHDAGESTLDIALSGKEGVNYVGDYLEVRLYQSDDQTGNPCEHCTIVYISREGKILGYSKY